MATFPRQANGSNSHPLASSTTGRRHTTYEELKGITRGGGRRRPGAAQGGGAGVARAVGQPAAVAGVGDGRRRRRRRRWRSPPCGEGAVPAVPIQAGGYGSGVAGRRSSATREVVGLWAVAVGHVRARHHRAEARVQPRHRRYGRAAGGRLAGSGEAEQGEPPQPEETLTSLLV
jgi:hypothetical protein